MVKTIICDIDGILCDNSRVPYFQKKPNIDNLNKLQVLYARGCNIILFTSRLSKYRKSTVKWLERHFVQYHKLIMNKPKGDVYIDDKSVRKVID